MKILITGGHMSPALAVIGELRSRAGTEIFMVGRKFALESEKTLSLEYKESQRMGVRFIPINAGRLNRYLTIKSLINLFKIPFGFIEAFFIIAKIRPDRVLSFGSYVAVPVVFWAYLRGIPVFTHEQTINPGLSNRIIGRMARTVYVAFPEASDYFKGSKVVVSGNPVRKSMKTVADRPFEVEDGKPVVYVTGGSLGSHSINVHLKNILPELLKEFTVIHQTGESSEYRDYEDLLFFRVNLPEDLKKRYFVRKHFYDNEIGFVYSVSDIIVARGGANTFFEILALKKPSIIIPLPWSAGREQQKHAEILAKLGIAEIFLQVETSKKLLNIIKRVHLDRNFFADNFNSLPKVYRNNAAQILADEITKTS